MDFSRFWQRFTPMMIYYAIILFTLVVIVPAFFLFRSNNSNSDDFKNVSSLLEDVEIKYEDDNINIQTVKLPHYVNTKKPFELKVNLDVSDGKLSEHSIGLYTSYMDFSCIIDGKVFYSLKTPKNFIPYSGGTYTYYVINLPENIKDPTLYIKFEPKLKFSSKYRINTIYIGKRTNFFSSLLYNDWLGIVLSGILIFVFLLTTIISLAIKNEDILVAKRIFNIGVLCLIMAVYYSIRFQIVSYLLSEYRAGVYIVEHVSFLFFTFPVIKLLEENVDDKFDNLLEIGIHMIFMNFTIQLVSTLLGIIDFKEMMPVTYIIFFIIFLISGISIIFSNSTEHPEKRILAISILPIFINVFAEALSYVRGTQVFTSLILLLNVIFFVGIQIFILIRTYFDIQNENIQNQFYEDMLIKDALTGLGSRYAFETHLEEIREQPRDVLVISIDLNNLKEINDNLGHSYGDQAIIKAGNYLKSTVPQADIYRIGGDEYVILWEGSFDTRIIEELKNKKLFINEKLQEIPISFALGYSRYDYNSNITIDEVLRRSDKSMYDDKIMHKRKILKMKKMKNIS